MSTKVSIIVAVVLLIVAFGVGLGVGRSTPQRRVAGATQSAKAQSHAGALSELAACQEELEAHSTPLSTASVPVPEDATSAAVEPVAKMEALEEELKQCTTRDMVFNAAMCTAGTRYFVLLLTGLHTDKACVDRFGVGDLILKHTEQCAKFEDNQSDPAEMDLEKSDAELSNLYDAQRFGRRNDGPGGDHKANLARHFKRTYRECQTKFGLSND